MPEVNFSKPKHCTVIAEISANHGRSFKRALRLIKEAKAAGADVVKFQTYTADSLTINCSRKYFRVKHPKWGGRTLYQLYDSAYTPWDWFPDLKRAADDEGITFFSTAFDTKAVDLLEELDVPAHKIASFELSDTGLIEYMAATKKPLILSTGAATVAEIRVAIDAARRAGARKIILLKCVSNYPARPADMNLRTIPDMARRFGYPVGLSDHSLGTGVSVAAVTLGAVMIEKHFTLSRKIETADNFFSMEPTEMKQLVEEVRTAEQALGKVFYGMTDSERKGSQSKRSLFVVQDMKAGERFTEENVRAIRPSDGLPPKYLKRVVRKKAGRRISKGTPLSWDMIV